MGRGKKNYKNEDEYVIKDLFTYKKITRNEWKDMTTDDKEQFFLFVKNRWIRKVMMCVTFNMLLPTFAAYLPDA